MSDIFDSDRRRRGRRLGTEPTTPNPEDRDMDPSDPSRLRALEDWRLILTGRDGNNGWFGNLRKEVASLSKLLKAVGGAAITGMLGAATALYAAGQKDGAREQELQFFRAELGALRAEVRDLRALDTARRVQPARPAPSGDIP